MFIEIFRTLVAENTFISVINFLLMIAIGWGGIFLYNKYISCKIHDRVSARWPDVDKFLLQIDKRLIALIKISIIYTAFQQLFLPDIIEQGVYFFVLIATTFQFVIFIQFVIIYFFKQYLARQEDTADQDKLLTITESFTKIVTWIIAVVFILDNLNIRISGLLAGLGVGGIALGIASQSIFQDIFSYFTIFIDKPFEIGDYIMIGEFRGVVEYIGIKSTRLRSLTGEQLVFSNTDLTSSRIHNFRRMRRRRINFKFGVTYDTPLEQLKEIPGIVKEIIETKNKTEFDRAHFHAYGDYSLIYEVIFYVQDKDYATYMDIQQEINFELKEIFKEKNISFAFPTQTINLTQENLVVPKNKEE